MKAKIDVLVIKYNGESIQVEGIHDMYTVVQIYIEEKYFDETVKESYLKYFSWEKELPESQNGYIRIGEYEAKDFPDLGNLTFEIQSVEINV